LLRQINPAEGVLWAGHALSPDGRTFAACARGGVRLIDLESGSQISWLETTSDPQEAIYSPDGRFLAIGAGRCAWLYDLVDRSVLPYRFPSFRRYCDSLAFHPSRPILATGGRDGEVRLWDIPTRKELVRFDWDIGAVHGLTFAPDGATAAAAGHNNTLVVWDVDL
jgi:WD40 repeat protein